MAPKSKLPIKRESGLERKKTDIRLLFKSWLADKSAATKHAYKDVLESFGAFADSDYQTAVASLVQCSSADANAIVLAYKTHLISQGRAPATINRHLSALRSLCGLARALGLSKATIAIKNAKSKPYRDTRGVGADGYHAMLAAVTGRNASRDIAILRLLHDLGLRRIEVITLRVDDLEDDGRFLRIRPKGGGELLWPTGELARAAIKAWLVERGTKPGALFPGRYGGLLSPSSVYRMVAKRGSAAGFRASPHKLRHTAITTALDRTGGDLRTVAKFSRHARIETVAVYDDRRGEKPREIISLIEAPESDD